MPYAIMRFAKRKRGAIHSMEAHNERKKESYKSNPDIDLNKHDSNYHLIQPKHSYYTEVMTRIERAGCKVRRDSVLMVDAIITASPEFMITLPAEEQREYFEHALRFIKREVGEQNVIAATVHKDEKTPHKHICFTPITPDGKLSAKLILGNQQKLSEWQTKFHECMSARWSVLERGISSMDTHRKHIPVWLYKKSQRLDMEFEQVKRALADINMLNAGRKRDEAIAILAKWVPEAEQFTAQVKLNRGYIDELEHDNLSLQMELRDKGEKLNEAWDEAYKFKKAADRQRSLLNRVPKEILEQIEKTKPRQRERGI